MKIWALIVVAVVWLALGFVVTAINGLAEGSGHGAAEEKVSAYSLTVPEG